MSYEDSDNDGDVDIIYYSPYSVNYSYDSTVIKSDNENLNGLTARDTLNPVYLSFADSVLKASGESEDVKEDDLTIDTAKDGDKILAEANEERSLIWASDYASITVDHVEGTSTASANWAKMSYLTGLSSYNVEIAMEWGMNALLYATNGGIVTVGSTDGEKSSFYANGDGSNGLWDVDGLSYTNSKGETTSLNGNYYGAESNFGISATFSGDSVWTVTHDSYLGSLTIEDSASITAPSRYKLLMTVDGKKTDIKAGTYTGKIMITVTKA